MITPNRGVLGGDLKGTLPSPSVIALTDWAGRRRPIKELLEGLFLKVEGGYIVTVPAGSIGTLLHNELTYASRWLPEQHPATAIKTTTTNFNNNLSVLDTDVQKALDTVDNLDIYQVRAQDSDTGHGSLYTKTANLNNIVRNIVTESSVQKVQFGVVISDATPLSDIEGGDPGDYSANAKPASYSHRHPLAPPPVDTGDKLHFVAIPNTRSLDAKAILAPVRRWNDVVCCFGVPSLCFSEIWIYWTEQEDGSMVRDDLGELTSDYFDGYSPSVNDRVLTYFNGINTDFDKQHLGIWIIDDLGSESTYATMHRATDADANLDFISQKVVNVLNGTNYGDHTFMYVGDTNPVLGTTLLDFQDRGDDSVYKDVPDGEMGFGTVWTVTDGICTWEKQGDTTESETFWASGTFWLGAEGLPANETLVNTDERFLIYGSGPYDGLYEIQKDGSGVAPYTQIIRRVPEANTSTTLTNVVIHITDDIAYYSGYYFQQTATIATIDVTNTTWTSYSYNPLEPTLELDSWAQISLRGASIEEVLKTKEVAGLSSDLTILDESIIYTPEGSPNLISIPAGRQTFQAKAYLLNWDSETNPGVTTIKFRAYKHPTVGFDTLLLESPCGIPLNNTVQTLIWQYDLISPVSLTETDRLGIIPLVSTTCEDPVTIIFMVNDPARQIWWQIPGVHFTTPYGTDSHPDLLNRNTDSLDGRGQHDSHTVMIDDNATEFTGNLVDIERLDEAMTVLDQLSGTDDHYVKTTTTDATDPGPLNVKLVTDDTLRSYIETVGGVERMGLGGIVSTENPLPSSLAGSSGTTTSNTRGSAWNHQHPEVPPLTPEDVGDKLHFVAIVNDRSLNAKSILAPVRRWTDAVCCFTAGLPPSCNFILWYGWTEQEDGSMVYDTTDALISDFFDGYSPSVGDRVLPYSPGVHTDFDKQHLGIWVIDSLGGGGNHATMHRATDADANLDFIQQKVVNVLNGINYGSHTFMYVGDTNPVLGTTLLDFQDRGDDSVYKDVPDGEMGFGSVWTVTSGVCTWQKHGDLVDETVILPTTTRWLAAEGLPADEVSETERFLVFDTSPFAGLYEVQTYRISQVIRRVPEVNTATTLTNVVIHITDPISYYSDYYFQQTATIATIDVTDTVWSSYNYNPLEPTLELDTWAQISLRGASTDEIVKTQEIIGEGTDVTILDESIIYTPEGSPNLSSIPAGRQTFQAKAYLLNWDSEANPGVTTIKFRAYKHPTVGFDTLLLESECGVPLSNTVQTLIWQYDLVSPVSLSETDRLGIIPLVSTTCLSSITIAFVVNDTIRQIWWQIPGVHFTTPYGTDSHPDLLNRNLPNQHLDISLLEQDLPSLATSSGLLDLTDGVADYLITGTEAIIGIKTPTDLTRKKLCLTIATGRQVLPNQDMSGHVGYSPIYTYLRPSPSTDLTILNPHNNSTLWFRFRSDLGTSGMWHYIGGNLS